MEVMIEEKQISSKLCEGFTQYPQTLINIPVCDKDAVMGDSDVMRVLEEERKKLGDNGRILVRKSGTEPVVRVMCEAVSEDMCRASARRVADAIPGTGG